MAYVIYCEDKNPGQLSRIAADVNERDNHLHGTMKYHEISESDFNDLKNNVKTAIGWDGTNITYKIHSGSISTVENLEEYLNMLKEDITSFLKVDYGYSTDHWQTYLDYLNTVDASTITLPIDSWEKYCSDNSITFYSMLQKP